MKNRFDAYDRHCRKIISEHGWMVQGVFPAEDDQGEPFAYTVGLTAAGRAELVIAGLPMETAQQLLNDAAKRSLTRELRAGDVLEEVASAPLRVVEAPSAEVNMARHLYRGRQVSALQLVWPDRDGAFPGEPEWSMGDAQPIYS
jgi:hypothetical protein